jgi:hypothetical protein
MRLDSKGSDELCQLCQKPEGLVHGKWAESHDFGSVTS